MSDIIDELGLLLSTQENLIPSPFPGLNPYLEQRSVWEDFHTRMIAHIGESLTEQIRPDFFVKLEERVFTHEPSAEERGKFPGKPDVSLFGSSRSSNVAVVSAMPEQLAAIVASIPDVEIEWHSFIEIRDRHNPELVTMIEMLSPSNQRYGPDREEYTMKRTALMYSPTSIVELDLLRDGPRFPLDGVPPCDYRVMVSRKAMRPQVEAWPIQLRDRLPSIPIPLKGDFPDAKLDLQALLNRVYDAAGYEDYLYKTPPEPPLSEADAEWANSFLSNVSG